MELQDEEMAMEWTALTKEEQVKRYCEMNLKNIDKLTSLQSITLGTGYIEGYEQKIYNFKLLYKMSKLIGLIFSCNNGIDELKLYKFKSLKNVTLYSVDFDSISFGKKSKIESVSIIMYNIKKRLDISQLKKFKAEHSVITNLKMGSKKNLKHSIYKLIWKI